MFHKYQFLIKVCIMTLLFSLLGLSVAACTVVSGSGGNSGSTATATATSSSVSTATPQTTSGPTTTPTQATTAPFQVTGVQIAVNPASIAGDACGSTLTVVYTATFHFLSGGPGGTVHFLYTVDNGRSSPTATLAATAGQTSKSYTFNWSGTLASDNVNPGLGGVIVTSPTPLTSQLIKPSGTCSTVSSSPFKVTGASISVSPKTLNGTHCGSQFTETYTATFHIVAHSPGGTIVFNYTTDNGRGNSSVVNLHVAAGQTTATYNFYWKGQLPNDHTEPENGAVDVTAPNALLSSLVGPTGSCS